RRWSGMDRHPMREEATAEPRLRPAGASVSPSPAPTLDRPIDRPGPTWKLVLALAWPVLIQQLLNFSVILSDSFLAGRFKPLHPEQHVASQSAQTTAHYLAWVVTSYTVLVAAGSTALVARFIGAGDQAKALHVTNQS